MTFATYSETRPWAKAIREAVRLRRMPPWFADPHVGKFANDRSLAQSDIDTLVQWADNGAPEGNPNDAPAPVAFVTGWNIGKPDLIIEMPKAYTVPAKGTIEYTYYVIPTGFTEDKWVQFAEVRPGNRKVVHHVIAFIREPGSKWMKDAVPGEPYVPKKGGDGEAGAGRQWLVGYAPGTISELTRPGQAVLIKAGSDVVLQMHYTAAGEEQTDRSRIGLVFSKEPPRQRIVVLAAANNKFVIPPGADNFKVESKITLQADTTVTALIPHMHLRGKAFEFRAVYPTGETEELLKVPRYDFNWQLGYLPEKSIVLPKGSRIECTAWFDNSANNPNNPDPKSEVRYGDQSWEEMMFGFFTATLDPKGDPADLVRAKKPQVSATFYKDVLPILQSRCQECHRQGEIGPMALTTYNEVRPWAKAIREVVRARKMPPWFADPAYGHFANDRSMSQSEIDLLTAWADSGGPEGNAKDAPLARSWPTGWGIAPPDVVFTMPSAFEVPAKGAVDYQYIVIPTGFTEDKWVQAVEARPSARSVVHHVVVYVREPGSKWLRGEAQAGVPFVPPRATPDGKPRSDIGGAGSDILTIYTPGNVPDTFRPNQAKLIKAGSDLVFQMHYTANGKTAAADKTSVGLIFAKQPPAERVLTVALANDKFVIPPGDGNHRAPAQATLPKGGTLLSFFPHMHVRGKAFEYKLAQPGAEQQTLLRVPNYNFNWQLTYRLEKPIALQPGAKMEVAGWFDNSPNNAFNPDPKAEVRWGEQSWEEMMIGFFDVAVPADMDRRSFFKR
jgi:hypothetical protein